MLRDDLLSIRAALGDILGSLPPDQAGIVRICRRNLEAAADQAAQMETWLVPPSDSDAAATSAQGVA